MGEDYYNGILGNDSDIAIDVFELALSKWTERTQLRKGYKELYNKRNLQFFDALIWTRVVNAKNRYIYLSNSLRECKKREQNESNTVEENSLISQLRQGLCSENYQKDIDKLMKSVNTWKYRGKLYRVMDCKQNQIDYHGLIASWTNDYKSFKNFNHLYDKQKYTFIVGSTGSDWGFDVNKYRQYIGERHIYTEHESEIIFPLDYKYVKDTFYGTLDGFYKYMREK